MEAVKQRTLASEVVFEGTGIHTGTHSRIVLKPAPPNSWYRFVVGQVVVPASVEYVRSSERGVTLEREGVSVSTVEHLLSALYAAQVDNVDIVFEEGTEVPALDGTAKPFFDAVREVGATVQDALRNWLVVDEAVVCEVGDSRVVAVPAGRLQLTVMIDFDSTVVGRQFARWSTADDYGNEIAPARTFAFLHEVLPLLEKGLAQGGSVENALVILDRLPTPEEEALLRQHFPEIELELREGDYLPLTPPRFDNEPARHKLLDLLGDMALAGRFVRADIYAYKPGHTVNVEFVRHLLAHEESRRAVPTYKPELPPLLTVPDIQYYLPHRAPFLLVDRIIELTDTRVVGVKAVSYNEPFFQGHFPDLPVMPGVLIIEAMAQTGGVLALKTVENPKEWDTFFLKIDNVKFKRMVIPGDVLVMVLELLAPIRRGLISMRGRAYVGRELVCEAEMLARIVKKVKRKQPGRG